ncbi:hypothetical protein D9619_013308 [Psilocybe cf. subviscida]|uniref:Uncharacterized protein n=1 Tax=Psilocybe cf. subviscida TaxID=2480587 RepID=A0A8H5F9D8_9AGAR|nr:hypothetical protein D9619_013308 [Psilocybe cf. subviscida]
MLCDTSVDMQSPDASMMVMSSADISMMSPGIQEELSSEGSLGMEELMRRLGELNPGSVLQPMLNRSHTDEVILGEIENQLGRLRTVTSIIANDQAGLHVLQQRLTDIHTVATNCLTSAVPVMSSNGLTEGDKAWLLTESGCQSILATCIRDWSSLALAWVIAVIHDLDAFDDKVVESMEALRGRRGDIKNSNNVFMRSGGSRGACVDQIIIAMQSFGLDEEISLTLPKRPVFPQLDTGFPSGFLSQEQEEFNQHAKGIHAFGVDLAKGHLITMANEVAYTDHINRTSKPDV